MLIHTNALHFIIIKKIWIPKVNDPLTVFVWRLIHERGAKSTLSHLNLKLDIFVLISMGDIRWKLNPDCFLTLNQETSLNLM